MVGTQKESPEWMAKVLEARDRSQAAPTFSPAGLYLAQIAYPAEFAIPGPALENSWLPRDIFVPK
jgi:tRNA pseudouridine38-40 synthase